MIAGEGVVFCVLLLPGLGVGKLLERIEPASQANLLNPQKFPGPNETRGIEQHQHDSNSLTGKRIIRQEQQAYPPGILLLYTL